MLYETRKGRHDELFFATTFLLLLTELIFYSNPESVSVYFLKESKFTWTSFSMDSCHITMCHISVQLFC